MMRKCFHISYAALLLLSSIALIACSEESETVRVTERYTLDMLGKGASLTEEKCDSARMGQLLYVGDSSSIYYCTGKVWKRANGVNGKDGRDGKDGVDGADGKKGSFGTSGTDCFAEEFADGFVLGCGATKAIVRYNFDLPDTCRIALRSDSSYVLTCGSDSTMLSQGPQGVAGDICKQADIGDGQVRLVCGSDSVILYKAACGDVPFDPDGSQFCYGDTLVDRCNTQAYDLKKRFCYNDSLVDLCGGKAYELKDQFCYGDSLVNLCGGKDYDLAQQFCYGDTLVDLCGGKSYSLLHSFCYGDSLVKLCDGKDYDLAQQFCFSDSLVDLCGGKAYDPETQFCHGDSLVKLCNGNAYELKDQFCYGDSLVNLCGGKNYDIKKQFCYNDSLVNLCGGKTYELNNQFCYSNSVVDLCGGREYDLKVQFCYNDSLVMLCGGAAYNLEEKFCYENNLMDFCNGDAYNPQMLFCYNDSLVRLCGGKNYDIEKQFCYGDSLVDLCGGKAYDTETQFCYNGIIADICAGLNYNPVTERCYEGVVVPKCPTELEDNQFCDERNGKVYRFTVIGGATWMAQNLDYRVPNSFCENSLRDSQRDDSLYCENEQMVEYTRRPVGRYYPWSVAMARTEDECGAGHQCPNLTYPHQGVCPEGWHLPDTTEWSALIAVMGDNSIAYWDQSVSLAYGTPKNSFGLSVIPTGIFGVTYSKNTNKFTRSSKANPESADIWSSTENDRTNQQAYLYYLYATKENNWQKINKLSYSKSMFARTVRCVKD